MNEADSDLMSRLLGRAGWSAVSSYEVADLVVINTCSVRERPEHKVFSVLGELRPWKKAHSTAVLAVSGCMAQRAADEIKRRAPHVDLIMGTRAYHRIEELVAQVLGLRREGRGNQPVVSLEMEADALGAADHGLLLVPSPQSLAPVVLRAFVPIIRGCSNYCSYCIVPYVRGPEASRSPSEIHRDIESLVSRGTREVTLLGQNVLAYGRDIPNAQTFSHLLSFLSGIDGLWRIRFMTSHPRDVYRRLIAAIAELPKVCEHIHLPIQAGTDRLLMLMGRGYTTARYLEIVDELRNRVPGIAITTDIMVGFPGETEEDFERSLRLYESTRFDAAFMFAYSPRPGTKAAAMDNQIPRKLIVERLVQVIEMQNRITVEKNEAVIGEEVEVLVDGPAPRGEGLMAGRARNNKQIIFPGTPSLSGSLVTVRLKKAHLWGFNGELQ